MRNALLLTAFVLALGGCLGPGYVALEAPYRPQGSVLMYADGSCWAYGSWYAYCPWFSAYGPYDEYPRYRTTYGPYVPPYVIYEGHPYRHGHRYVPPRVRDHRPRRVIVPVRPRPYRHR